MSTEESHEAHSTKRRRDEAEAPAPAPERSDIWYEDGNIVLSAQGKMLFCVYRGILCDKSPVFRDMFSFSQPDAQETVDGKPIVLLHDSPDEITHMLRALYDWHKYFPADGAWNSQSIIALLHTGSKYQIDHLRGEAISRLFRAFPTTLDAFDAIDATSLIKDWETYCIPLAKCALSYGLRSTLPALLLSSENFSMTELLDAYRADQLPFADLHRLLNACQRLMVHQTTTMPRCLLVANDQCEMPAECLQARMDGLAKMFEASPNQYTALICLVHDVSFPWPDLCASCHVLCQQEYNVQRRVLWDTVPSFLGFPGWEVLEFEQERDAMLADVPIHT